MTSPRQFHERDGAVSDTVAPGIMAFQEITRSRNHGAPGNHAFCPLAVSLDSMVKMAS